MRWVCCFSCCTPAECPSDVENAKQWPLAVCVVECKQTVVGEFPQCGHKRRKREDKCSSLHNVLIDIIDTKNDSKNDTTNIYRNSSRRTRRICTKNICRIRTCVATIEAQSSPLCAVAIRIYQLNCPTLYSASPTKSRVTTFPATSYTNTINATCADRTYARPPT